MRKRRASSDHGACVQQHCIGDVLRVGDDGLRLRAVWDQFRLLGRRRRSLLQHESLDVLRGHAGSGVPSSTRAACSSRNSVFVCFFRELSRTDRPKPRSHTFLPACVCIDSYARTRASGFLSVGRDGSDARARATTHPWHHRRARVVARRRGAASGTRGRVRPRGARTTPPRYRQPRACSATLPRGHEAILPSHTPMQATSNLHGTGGTTCALQVWITLRCLRRTTRLTLHCSMSSLHAPFACPTPFLPRGTLGPTTTNTAQRGGPSSCLPSRSW